MMNYLLRNVPADLWGEFRDRARVDQLTAREILIALIRQYVRHGLPRGW